MEDLNQVKAAMMAIGNLNIKCTNDDRTLVRRYVEGLYASGWYTGKMSFDVFSGEKRIGSIYLDFESYNDDKKGRVSINGFVTYCYTNPLMAFLEERFPNAVPKVKQIGRARF